MIGVRPRRYILCIEGGGAVNFVINQEAVETSRGYKVGTGGCSPLSLCVSYYSGNFPHYPPTRPTPGFLRMVVLALAPSRVGKGLAG